MAKFHDLGIPPVSFLAGADYSASQNRYLFITWSASADKVLVATGTSAPKVIGILQNSPCSGEEAAVAMLGFSKLRTRTTTCVVAIGDALTSDSVGYGIKLTTTGCDMAYAVALEAISSGSAIINVFLTPFAVVGAETS